MSSNEIDENKSVAVYWDFENLHAALAEAKNGEGSYGKPDARFKPQEPLIDVQAVVELGSSFGPIAINRAYCNWQFYGRYRDTLLQSAVELIQLFPPGASAKNGADIKLCLAAVEDISRFNHIGTIIIVGGDSDFMPVAQKIKAAGRSGHAQAGRSTVGRDQGRSVGEQGRDLANDQTSRFNVRYQGARPRYVFGHGQGAQRHRRSKKGRVRSRCPTALKDGSDRAGHALMVRMQTPCRACRESAHWPDASTALWGGLLALQAHVRLESHQRFHHGLQVRCRQGAQHHLVADSSHMNLRAFETKLFGQDYGVAAAMGKTVWLRS
jgi:NYN domain